MLQLIDRQMEKTRCKWCGKGVEGVDYRPEFGGGRWISCRDNYRMYLCRGCEYERVASDMREGYGVTLQFTFVCQPDGVIRPVMTTVDGVWVRPVIKLNLCKRVSKRDSRHHNAEFAFETVDGHTWRGTRYDSFDRAVYCKRVARKGK